jgi:hypothetical protein
MAREPCLYCADVAHSEEHPLPAALGEFRGAPTLIDRICRECNSRRIGLLDEQFVRCSPASFFRYRFGVPSSRNRSQVMHRAKGSDVGPYN